MQNTITIEVAFATREQQKIISVTIDHDCTIKEAIRSSGLSEFFPEYDLLDLPVGVFGKRLFSTANYRFKAGDRLEIYRPLVRSPNQIRLERAKNK